MSENERQRMTRQVIPAFPRPIAIIYCVLNFLIPGIGTLFASVTNCCVADNTDMSAADVVATGCISFFFAISQMALSLCCFVGWIWSCVWGGYFVAVSNQYYTGNIFRRPREREPNGNLSIVGDGRLTSNNTLGYHEQMYYDPITRQPIPLSMYANIGPPSYTPKEAPPSYEQLFGAQQQNPQPPSTQQQQAVTQPSTVEYSTTTGGNRPVIDDGILMPIFAVAAPTQFSSARARADYNNSAGSTRESTSRNASGVTRNTGNNRTGRAATALDLLKARSSRFQSVTPLVPWNPRPRTASIRLPPVVVPPSTRTSQISIDSVDEILQLPAETAVIRADPSMYRPPSEQQENTSNHLQIDNSNAAVPTTHPSRPHSSAVINVQCPTVETISQRATTCVPDRRVTSQDLHDAALRNDTEEAEPFSDVEDVV